MKDFREILVNEFENRRLRNPAYSLRRFAQHLSMSSGRLTEVLSANAGLSVAKARIIAEKLNFDQHEQQTFCLSVEKLHSRSKVKREKAAAMLKTLEVRRSRGQKLSQDQFTFISGWHNYAILEILAWPNISSNGDQALVISRKLELDTRTVRLALQRMERLNLVSRNSEGRWAVNVGHTISEYGEASEALKALHAQLLEMGRQAIWNETVEARELNSVILSISKDAMPEAKKLLREFRSRFCQLMEQFEANENEVYGLSTVLFPLTGKDSKSE